MGFDSARLGGAVTGRRRTRARRARCALLLGALGCAVAAGGASAAQDEIVPAGAWSHELALFYQEQDRAYNRFGNLTALRSFLLPGLDARRTTTGFITRTVTRLEFRFTYGLSDSWNLSLEIPYLSLDQDSKLVSTSTDPLVGEEVKSFRRQSLSGLGDGRLTLLHRPLFSDRNAVLWGFGYTQALADREARPGQHALGLGSPSPSLRAFVHYTRFPRVERSRFDLRFQFEMGIDGEIDTFDEGSQPFRKGNAATFQLGWSQEFGRFAAGVQLSEMRRSQSRLDGAGQDDPEKETAARLRLGYGNLVELERQPLPFPYLLTIEFERSLRGFNVIFRDGTTLSLQYFF